MSRFDKLFKDISKRARNPDEVEEILLILLDKVIKYQTMIENIMEITGGLNEKVVASIDSGDVVELRRVNGAGNTLG